MTPARRLLCLFGANVDVLPGTFVCLGIALFGVVTAWVVPLSARLSYDPSLQYLLASLSWFRGKSYAYVDHPGTPVEVLGTLVLGLSYPVLHAFNEGFVNHYLRHPQEFLSVGQTLVTCTSVLAVMLVARLSVPVGHWTTAVMGAALPALFFAVLPDSFRSLTIWSHESFCFPMGTLHSLALLIAVRRPTGPSWQAQVGLGLASGALTSIQLYFAAWIVGTMIAVGAAARLRSGAWRPAIWRATLVALMAALGFIMATLPIHARYKTFLNWLWQVASHEGTYGRGSSGFPNPILMLSNLVQLGLHAQWLFAAVAVVVAVFGSRLWWTRRNRATHPALWSAGPGLLGQLLVLLLLNAKHPGFDTRYLLPVAVTLPLLLATAVQDLQHWPEQPRKLLTAFSFGALAVFGVAEWSAIDLQLRSADWLRQTDAATESVLANLAEAQGVKRESLRTLWTYGTLSPCYALWFSEDTSDGAFRKDIDGVCPNDSALSIWSKRVSTGGGDIQIADYFGWDVIVMPESVHQLAPDSDQILSEAQPLGVVQRSSIDSLSLGKLLFISHLK